MHENFISKIENDEKKINNEIFKKYFRYQNPSFLGKDLYKVDQAKNEEMISQVNDALT